MLFWQAFEEAVLLSALRCSKCKQHAIAEPTCLYWGCHILFVWGGGRLHRIFCDFLESYTSTRRFIFLSLDTGKHLMNVWLNKNFLYEAGVLTTSVICLVIYIHKFCAKVQNADQSWRKISLHSILDPGQKSSAVDPRIPRAGMVKFLCADMHWNKM